jgi:pimeloyl-ACP methyl ester carboxylesterase
MNERDVTLRDGRTLHVYEDGDLGGAAVVVHHGTPGSGLLYERSIEDARTRGIRLIGYDRAGYGGSTPKPGRVVADVAADIADALDALAVERFASIGGSRAGQVRRRLRNRVARTVAGRRPRLARGPGRAEPGGVGGCAGRPRGA